MKSLTKTLLIGTYLGGILSTHAQEQGYRDIAPKPVPPVAPGSVTPPPAPPTAAKDNRLVLPDLKALVFLATPMEVDHSGTKAVEPVVVTSKLDVPDPAAFRAMVTPYIGKPLTHGQLNELINSVILYYRKNDRPIVDVIVPVQKITNGIIQIVVLEGKVGTVTVTGNRWFPSNTIRNSMSVQPGDKIRASQIQSDLDWANQNPFHSSDLVYQPGAKLGETNLVLQTKDRFPARFYAGYENTGNSSTGFDRYLVGMNWGDAFALGLNQQLNYQFTTSGDFNSLRAHTGSYLIPLPWKHNLTFFGSYAETQGSVPPLIGLNGTSYQVSGRYDVPLPLVTFPNVLTYKQTVGAGFDHKYNDNSLLFGGVPLPDTLYDVNQFVITYNGAETDAYGQTTISNQFYLSPGDWGANNDNAAFNMAHTGATANYLYNTLVLERMTKLPQDFSLILRGTVQISSANLAPSEQLGYGGYDTVRGYDQREVNSDEGFIFTTEVRSPSMSIGKLFNWQGYNDQLQLLTFWDYGSASNHTVLPGESTEIGMSGIGFGVRYNINTYLSFRYDLGFQLTSTGLDNDHGKRSDIGLVLSY